MLGLRRNLAEELQEALPEPHSALAQALLLGLRGQLPPGVKEDFRRPAPPICWPSPVCTLGC